MVIKDIKLFEVTSLASLIEDDLEKTVGLGVTASLDREYYIDFVEYSVDRVLYGSSALDYDSTQPNPEENLVSLGLVPTEAQALLNKWEDATRERFYTSGVATSAQYDFRTYDFELTIYPDEGPVLVKVETSTPLEEGAASRI